MNESTELYAKTSPLRLFFMIAIPGAISMTASSLWGLLDGIFVGNLLGETAFAALNLAMPFVIINFSLADLIGVGSAVHIAVLLGRREEAEANNYFICACLMIVLVSFLTGAALFACAPFLMRLMGAQGELGELAVRYIRVYALTSPLTTMTFAADNFLRICGKIRGSMALNIAMSALILGLEYLFLGVLGMDIAGSALAVSLGMFLCTAMALWPFARGRMCLRFCRPRLTLRMARRIVAGGSPNFLSNVASRLTSILMNAVLLSMGGSVAVSAYGILMYAGDTVQQLLYGTCDGMQPAIGYNWGAGDRGRVRSLFRCSLAACAVISIGGAALMMAFPDEIAGLFAQQSERELLSLSAYALKLYALTYLTRWFGFAVQSLLVTLEKPLPATLLSLANALAIPVALLPALWPLGLDGLWLNTPVTALLVSLLALIACARLKRNGLGRARDGESRGTDAPG